MRAPILRDGERLRVRQAMRADYEGGKTVREIAEQYERSYGTAHKLLTEAGTEMRGRGGFHGR